MNKPNQKSSSATVSPSVTQRPATGKVAPGKPATTTPAASKPVKTTDAPMHAAQGNDDTMSQPQASKVQTGKKTS